MTLIVTCPHCGDYIIILKLNCRIFRHGVFKDSLQQIPPHLDKPSCDKILKKIYGCGKPFQITSDNQAIICDYI